MQYIVIAGWIISIGLALSGAFMYPVNQWGIVEVVVWEAVVIGWLSLLMLLIYKKSLPGQ